jgi:hypothetical protein
MGSEHQDRDEQAADPRDAAGPEYTEGGDPVCWAHLVCPECGAITSEGHRAGCAAARAASGEVLDAARRDAQE